MELQFNSTDDNVILGRWINHNRPQFWNLTREKWDNVFSGRFAGAYIFIGCRLEQYDGAAVSGHYYGSILQRSYLIYSHWWESIPGQGSLNYEHDQQYTLPVAFYDSDKNDQKSVERLVSIMVTNVNESHSLAALPIENNIAKYEFSVEEESIRL